MPITAAERGLALGSSSPPYHRIIPIQVPGAEGARRLARASLLVLDAPNAEHDWIDFHRAVAAVRLRFPEAPVVLRIPGATDVTVRLAHRASRVGVRAVIGVGEPLPEVLRPILTDPASVPDDLVDWLKMRGIGIPPTLEELTRQMLERGHQFQHLSEFLAASGEPERTVRDRFTRAGLPEPRSWHRCARALNAALRLQANPAIRLLDLAVELGYADHSGLTRQFTRAFGVTPAAIRGTLGWEWLAERWRVRSGMQG